MSIVPATKEDYQATSVGAILPANIMEAVTMAKTLFESRLFPDLQNAQQAVAKILAGAELGIPPIQALNSFHIVKGKIMAHYSTIAAGVRRAGYDYRVLAHTDEVCEIEFLGRDKSVIGEHSYSVSEAKKQGTQNMEKLPKVMLFARCISQGARMYVPEAFNGAVIYSHEERGIIEEEIPIVEDQTPGTSAFLEAKFIGEEVDPEFNPFPSEEQPTLEVTE